MAALPNAGGGKSDALLVEALRQVLDANAPGTADDE